jgi:hypothetical protein
MSQVGRWIFTLRLLSVRPGRKSLLQYNPTFTRRHIPYLGKVNDSMSTASDALAVSSYPPVAGGTSTIVVLYLGLVPLLHYTLVGC